MKQLKKILFIVSLSRWSQREEKKKKKTLVNKKKPPGVLGSWRGSSLLQPVRNSLYVK